jgi:hypothetical protein
MISLDMRINLRSIYRCSTKRQEPLITCSMEKCLLFKGQSITYLLGIWEQSKWNRRPFIFDGFIDDKMRTRKPLKRSY